MKYREAIGVIGGMGSYATLYLFQSILDAFPAEKEWDRPRILLDNRCTMPSRVKALLTGEGKDELIRSLTQTTRNLLSGGADYLIYACNTSHAFLGDILRECPEADGKIVHIIEALAKGMQRDGIREAYLLASEGTIQSGLYASVFAPYGISLTVPDETCYGVIRGYIETVKQNAVTPAAKEEFLRYTRGLGHRNVILGCTELPILADGYTGDEPVFWNPLDEAIREIKERIR